MMDTCRIDFGNPARITCLLCHHTSTDPFDVREQHCTRCRRYHSQAITEGSRRMLEALELLRPDLLRQQHVDLLEAFLMVIDPAPRVYGVRSSSPIPVDLPETYRT